MRVTVAAIQLTSTDQWEDNLQKSEAWISEAAVAGAHIVALPENFAYLRSEGEEIPCAQTLDGEFISRMKKLAMSHRIHILCGSIPERIPGSDKIYNTSVFLNSEGEIIAVYRKIHLFDVHMEGRADFRESKFVQAGEEVVSVDTEFGKVGLTVCYDLRFPELYRRLTRNGSRIIFVPSAFTEYTGKDHWSVLLRARAIENQVFVVAPAQFGQHNRKRRSYGKSMIVDPWGTMLATASDQEGMITAVLDLDFQDRIRRELPALEHTQKMFPI